MSGVLHQPEDIQRFRIAALRQALKLEMVGMRPRGASAYSILRHMFGGRTRQQCEQRVAAWLSATAPGRRQE